jgi:hypothetical protein
MSTEKERKSTRWSRWRERRREKALRGSEMTRKMYQARSRSEKHGDGRGSGDGGSFSGGVGIGGM